MKVLRDEVRKLPFGDRLRLVSELESDLDADEPVALREVEAAWDAQEELRAHDIVTGEVKLRSHEELISRLDEVRAKYSA